MSKVIRPKTLLEAVRYFADPQVCRDFMVALRWPDGVICPRCGSKEVTYLENARVWKCRGKHKAQKFSAKVGTIMEDSPIGLDKWLPCMWLIASCKNGISSYEVARGLKITQKSAWFMLHRIRLAMQESGGMLGGGLFGKPVEVDETYIGGAARSMNAKRRKAIVKGSGPHMSGKTMVMGILERGGRIRAKVVGDLTRSTLAGEISKNVRRGSTVYTDENRAYDGLTEPHFFHDAVNHAETYVRGNVHTNGIENFWSLLKRGLRGTYISVEPFHLFRYVDEQAFRFNTRKAKDGERFADVVRMIVGKRLTYQRLIGADSQPTTA